MDASSQPFEAKVKSQNLVEIAKPHKAIHPSTMVYIDVERAVYGEHGEEEFTTRVAHNIEEDRELFEGGFEYVTERHGARFIRRGSKRVKV